VDDAQPADARRASHADRDAVAERLREAAADGRLTLDELDERLGGASGARTYAELDRLTADLPDPGPATAVVPRPTAIALEQRDTAGDPPPDAPVVKVRGLALMGGIDAVRRPRRGNTAVEAPHRRELGR